MEALWALVNVNQMIALMPLMSISFPLNTLLLFKILAFLNGDVLILQQAYALSVGRLLRFPPESSPYNERFSLLGYESVKLLDNSGVFILTWLILMLFLLLALFIHLLFRRGRPCCRHCSRSMVLCVLWSPFLRTFIETFLELGFCSVINLLFVSTSHLSSRSSLSLTWCPLCSLSWCSSFCCSSPSSFSASSVSLLRSSPRRTTRASSVKSTFTRTVPPATCVASTTLSSCYTATSSSSSSSL